MQTKTWQQEANLSFALSEYIYKRYVAFQTVLGIGYGEPRVGKSSYFIQVQKDLFRHYDKMIPRIDRKAFIDYASTMNIKEPEMNYWRIFIVFKPEHFIELVKYLMRHQCRAILLIWDDAGLWMFALDWNDPKVKSALKFLQVCGTVTGSMIMTTPSIKMILKKVFEIEGIHVTKVIRASDLTKPNKRNAKTYRNSLAPWGKRFLRNVTDDDFNVMLPEEDYRWYKPLRESYLAEALAMLSEAYGVPVESVNQAAAMAQGLPVISD